MKDATAAVMLIATAIVLLVLWKLSTAFNADFVVTAKAVGATVVWCAVAGGIWWFMRFDPWMLLSGSLVFAWPCWWAVLDSSASRSLHPIGGLFTTFSAPTDLPVELWWNSMWFKGGIEAALVAWFGYQLYRTFGNGRGYGHRY